jgi:hypothetical protein
MIHENVYGTADTPLRKSENRDRHCRSPEKNHGGQYVVCGDPDTHRQPAKTRDIMTGFQAGNLSANTPAPRLMRSDPSTLRAATIPPGPE